jgi:hypothetical protein
MDHHPMHAQQNAQHIEAVQAMNLRVLPNGKLHF